jgi:hypothetical protein
MTGERLRPRPHTSKRSRCLRALPAIVAAVVILGAPAAEAASSSAETLPVPVQALEQKMAQINLLSVRFSVLVTGTDEGAGQPQVGAHRGAPRTDVEKQVDEVDVAAARAETFTDSLRRPSTIAIGSTFYVYLRRPRGRPRWVRSVDPEDARSAVRPPFEAQPGEANSGGAGSFGQLINLLNTASGPVGVSAPVFLDGQRTTEITATIHLLGGPLEAQAPVSSGEPSGGLFGPQRLEMFVTEAGLPVRVSVDAPLLGDRISIVTDVEAVDIPLRIERPPAREIVSAAQFTREIKREHHRAHRPLQK